MSSIAGGSGEAGPSDGGGGAMGGAGVGPPPVAGRGTSTRFRAVGGVKGPAPPGLCKKLVFSGTPEQDPFVKEAIQSMTTSIQIDHDVDVGLRAMQKEAHEQRLKNLRELLTLVSQEDWMYSTPDRLIGLQ